MAEFSSRRDTIPKEAALYQNGTTVGRLATALLELCQQMTRSAARGPMPFLLAVRATRWKHRGKTGSISASIFPALLEFLSSSVAVRASLR